MRLTRLSTGRHRGVVVVEPGITDPTPTGSQPVPALTTPVGSAADATLGTNLAVPVATTVAAGSFLFARVAHAYADTPPTITDTGGNTWTRDRTGASTGTLLRLSIYSCKVATAITASSTAITVTFPSSTHRVAVVDRFAGTAAVTPLNASEGASRNSATPGLSGGAASTSTGVLWLDALVTNGPATDTYTDAPGWTPLPSQTTTAVTMRGAWRVMDTAAGLAHSGTLSATRNWVDFVAAYNVTLPAPTGGFSDVVRSIPGLTHYYPLDATNTTTDLIAGHNAINHGATFTTAGATFNGSTYVEIPDHADFSLAAMASQEMTILAFQTVDNWSGSGLVDDGSGDFYLHWMAKGTIGAFEWTFRHYTATSVNRPKRTSVYHFNASGGLGAGSYIQDDDAAGAERVLFAMFDTTTTSLSDDSANTAYPGSTTIWKGHTKRDQDGFYGGTSNYNIVPTNTTTPVRVGTRGDGTGFLVGKVRRLAFFNRKLTQAEVDWLYAARDLPETAVAPTTLLSENYTGTDGSTITSEAACNFNGSFSTLTEHTFTGTSLWAMDTGTLIRKSGWGWTGKASVYGSPFFFRCRTRTVTAADTTVEFDYKVASWASGSSGSNSSSDGTAVWFRYGTQWGPLYEVYIDKFDNKVGAKRKVPAIGYTGTAGTANNGVYYTLKSDASCPVIGAGTLQATYAAVGSSSLVRDATDTTGAGGTSYHFKITCKTIATDKVQIQIFRDGVLVWSCTDNANDCIAESNSVSLAADLTASRYNTADSRWNAATMAHPIQVAGYTGVRCDNAQAFFDNFTVTTP